MEAPKTTENMSQQENIERIANLNFDAWNSALQTKDPEAVAGLYSTDTAFLPTVSGKFIRDREGTTEYFEKFLRKNPVGEIIEAKVQLLAPNVYSHVGKYNFTVGPDDNRHVVEARFIFTWVQNSEGKWEIVNHHSSFTPKEPQPS